MEGEFVAILAAQRVGSRAGLQEQPLVAVSHLHDGQRGGRVDLAYQHGSAILLEHALGLGRGGSGIDRIFRHDVQLAPHDAAALVDFFHGQFHTEGGVSAERAEKAGQRREMADFDLFGLAVADGRKSDCGGAGKGGARFQ